MYKVLLSLSTPQADVLLVYQTKILAKGPSSFSGRDMMEDIEWFLYVAEVLNNPPSRQFLRTLLSSIKETNQEEESGRKRIADLALRIEKISRRMTTSPLGRERQPPFAPSSNHGQGGNPNGDAWG